MKALSEFGAGENVSVIIKKVFKSVDLYFNSWYNIYER
jgi:hypothetical protein